MALRQKLLKPFVVEPKDGSDHTHTVVFLHRFPESTTEEEMANKVISTKRTSRNHKTLREQFPTVRWVFPYPKSGAGPYANLTAEDKAAVGLANSATPYIAQILLQEAGKLEGGLEKVILGGQGETAVAGHGAMQSFPEIPAAIRGQPDAVAEFLQATFHAAHWTDAASHPRLAAYVGMHAENGEITRDLVTYRTESMRISTRPAGLIASVNSSIVRNTPHRFIHGGYKVHNAQWDGRRIDDFAKVLAEDLSVYRVPDETPAAASASASNTKPSASAEAANHEKNERDKYLAAAAAEKKANEERVKIIKMRIEADKAERKYRLEREQEARKFAEIAAEQKKAKEEEERKRAEAKAEEEKKNENKGQPGTSSGGAA